MSLTPVHFYDLGPTSVGIITKCSLLSGEATHINFKFFDLIKSVFKPTIPCTRGEHATTRPPSYSTNNTRTTGVLKCSKFSIYVIIIKFYSKQHPCIMRTQSLNYFTNCKMHFSLVGDHFER